VRLSENDLQVAAAAEFGGLDEVAALSLLRETATELLAARRVIDAAEAYRAVAALKNPEQAAELLSALDVALLGYRLAVGDD
jgi:hypothetical protein